MGEYQSSRLDGVFNALCDPTRRAILARLTDSDARITDIAGGPLALRPAHGIPDVLSGGDLASMIQRDVLPGLDVLAKGTLPSHPSELLMSSRCNRMRSSTDPVAAPSPNDTGGGSPSRMLA